MKKFLLLLIAVIMMTSIALVGCGGGDKGNSQSPQESETESVAGSEVASETVSVPEVVEPEMSADLKALIEEKGKIDKEIKQYELEGQETLVLLGAYPSVEGAKESAVSISGNSVTISDYGTYRLEGSFSGTVYVTAEKLSGKCVTLILAGVEITGVDGPAICAYGETDLVLYAEDKTDNYFTDCKTYNEQNATGKYTGAVYAKGDLTVLGTGKITVEGKNKHGLYTKDVLCIKDTEVVVTGAVKSGIKGDDATIIKNAKITVTSSGDGIKAESVDPDDELNPTYYEGYVYVENSVLVLNGGDDAIQAYSYVVLVSSDVTINTAVTGNGINANRLISVEESIVNIVSYADGKDALNCRADEDADGNPLHYSGIVIDGESEVNCNGGVELFDSEEVCVYQGAKIS